MHVYTAYDVTGWYPLISEGLAVMWILGIESWSSLRVARALRS